MRWQTGEVRNAVVYFSTNVDQPAIGLTPVVLTAAKVADSSSVTTGAVAEISGGLYRIPFTATQAGGYAFVIDGGASLDNAHRYVPLEVPVGGYVDSIDATTSSRASATALAALQTDMTTVLTRLSAARAVLLDNLGSLDATISSRATHTEATSDTAGTTTLLSRLTATRAGLLDALTLLDVAVSSRASATALAALQAAVSTLGTPAQASALAALVSTVGSPAQALALTSAVVAVLAEVDTRATKADVAVTVSSQRVEVGP